MFNYANRPKSGQNLRVTERSDTLQTVDKFRAIVAQSPIQPLTRKEIAKDIFLEKELDTTKTVDTQYIFRIVSKTLKVITFFADFTGSDKCEFLEGTVKKSKDAQGNDVTENKKQF